MLKMLVFISLSLNLQAKELYNCKSTSNFGKQLKKLQELSKELSKQELKQQSALKLGLK